MEDVTPRIVEAAMAASTSQNKGFARYIEAAMHQAIVQAADEGISDPRQIKARILAARELAKSDYWLPE